MVDDEGLADDAGDGVHRAVARALGTALAAPGVDIEKDEFLIGAGQVLFNDALLSALMFQNGQNLPCDAFAETAARRMVDESAEFGKQRQFFGGGKGLFRGGKNLLHLSCAFTAGNALAAALIAGKFFKNGQGLLCFR